MDEKVNRIAREDPLPDPGYYELTAPLGSGKSTKYPLELYNKYGRVCVIEPFIGLAKQVGERLGFSYRF